MLTCAELYALKNLSSYHAALEKWHHEICKLGAVFLGFASGTGDVEPILRLLEFSQGHAFKDQ